jgi:hypothetical protein
MFLFEKAFKRSHTSRKVHDFLSSFIAPSCTACLFVDELCLLEKLVSKHLVELGLECS